MKSHLHHHAIYFYHRALVAIAQELGGGYLRRILTSLQDALVEGHGYQVHVLAHTMHAVVAAVAAEYIPAKPPLPQFMTEGLEQQQEQGGDAMQEGGENEDGDNSGGSAMVVASCSSASAASLPHQIITANTNTNTKGQPSGQGWVDGCVKVVLEVVMEDLFGEVSKAKESETYQGTMSKIKEAQGAASFDTFEVMATSITFLPCPSLHQLLAPVLQKIQDDPPPSSKELHKINEVLRRVSVGITKNPSVR